MMSTVRNVFALLTLCMPGLAQANDNALVYVYQDNCGACIKFDSEVANIYPKSAEAKVLPLVKVSLEDWRSGDNPYASCLRQDVVGTPTFIHLSGCDELDRINGYSSDELFWLGVARMYNTVGKTTPVGEARS